MKQYFSLLFFSLSLLTGCASDEAQIMEEASTLAAERAANLSISLPYQKGPLHIFSAHSKQNIVKITIFYNNQSAHVPHLAESTIASYCADKEVIDILRKGVVYRIFMRNEKGNVILDQFIDNTSCQPKQQKDSKA